MSDRAASYTPGPWGIPTSPWAVWAGDQQIASCRWLDDYGDFSRECADSEEAHANARLIAATPDMYEALRVARIALAKAGHHDGLSAVLMEVDAAIAKAEGRHE